ncbi:MAG: hypothetical protein M3252_04070 [Actinomycetota bacterium]|nr:hypothetical protein [Actinomycetota bacterium]
MRARYSLGFRLEWVEGYGGPIPEVDVTYERGPAPAIRHASQCHWMPSDLRFRAATVSLKGSA